MLQPDLNADPTVLALMPARERVHASAQVRIATPQAYKDAADLLKSIKGSLATIEDARTRITVPLNDSLREVNAQARLAAAPFLADEQLIKRAMLAYVNQQDELRRKEQEKANAKAEAERKRLLEAAERNAAKGNEDKADQFEARAAAVVAPVFAHVAAPKVEGVSTRDVWKFEVIDAAAINPAFLIPDETKIRKLVLSMQKNAASILGPGVRIWCEKQLASSSS